MINVKSEGGRLLQDTSSHRQRNVEHWLVKLCARRDVVSTQALAGLRDGRGLFYAGRAWTIFNSQAFSQQDEFSTVFHKSRASTRNHDESI
jgi:hypothetical protein